MSSVLVGANGYFPKCGVVLLVVGDNCVVNRRIFKLLIAETNGLDMSSLLWFICVVMFGNIQ